MTRPVITRTRLALLGVVLASVLSVRSARAQGSSPSANQQERYAPLLLKLPVSARLLALGGAHVAMRDVDAVFGNPALVGVGTALAFGAERYASGATSGQLASSSTIGPLGIGVGAQMLTRGDSYGAFPTRSDALIEAPSFGMSSMAATLAASLSWKQMRWGVGVKYLEERANATRANGVAFDVGVSRSITVANSTVGIAVQNIGGRMSTGGRSEQLPTQLALGLSTGARGLGKWFDVGGTTELDVRRDGQLFPRGGVELSYVPIEGVSFVGRVGGRRPQLLAERAVTAGAGVSLDRLTIDYAWEPLRDGAGHRVTVRLR